MVGRNEAFVAPSPWTQITVLPAPAETIEIRPAFRVFTESKARRDGVGLAVGGGEEAHAHVEAAADAEPSG